MSKVIIFSRTFPSYHQRKGEPTYFIEKLNKSLSISEYGIPFLDDTETYFKDFGVEFNQKVFKDCLPKHHTIRAGNRYKAGDTFSPRCWSGNPYKSKQVKISPDIIIKKVFDFEIVIDDYYEKSLINIDGKNFNNDRIIEVAHNDGLETADLLLWFQFPKPFKGQIICWNENINY